MRMDHRCVAAVALMAAALLATGCTSAPDPVVKVPTDEEKLLVGAATVDRIIDVIVERPLVPDAGCIQPLLDPPPPPNCYPIPLEHRIKENAAIERLLEMEIESLLFDHSTRLIDGKAAEPSRQPDGADPTPSSTIR